ATSAARNQTERPAIVHSSLYLPDPICEALRKIVFSSAGKNPRSRAGRYRCRVAPAWISVGRESQSQEEAVKFLGRLGQRALRSGGRQRSLRAGQSRLEGRFLGVVERGLHHCAALALETLEHLICGDFAHEH